MPIGLEHSQKRNIIKKNYIEIIEKKVLRD